MSIRKKGPRFIISSNRLLGGVESAVVLTSGGKNSLERDLNLGQQITSKMHKALTTRLSYVCVWLLSMLCVVCGLVCFGVCVCVCGWDSLVVSVMRSWSADPSSIPVQEDFSSWVNISADSTFPKSPFRWDYEPRSCVQTHAEHLAHTLKPLFKRVGHCVPVGTNNKIDKTAYVQGLDVNQKKAMSAYSIILEIEEE